MEHDYGAASGKALDVVDDFLGGDKAGIVAGDYVIHNHVQVFLNRMSLAEAQQAVRGSEQGAVDDFLGLEDVTDISAEGGFASAHMVHGVVADGVAGVDHLAIKLRIAPGVVANHEEGGFDAVMLENLQNPGCCFRHGAIVESQVGDLSAGYLNSPDGLREEEAIEHRGLDNQPLEEVHPRN